MSETAIEVVADETAKPVDPDLAKNLRTRHEIAFVVRTFLGSLNDWLERETTEQEDQQIGGKAETVLECLVPLCADETLELRMPGVSTELRFQALELEGVLADFRDDPNGNWNWAQTECKKYLLLNASE
jgi:hypothetical protein